MRKTKQILDSEYTSTYESVFKQIFKYHDVFNEFWFSSNIAQRILINPQALELDNTRMDALIEAMVAIGDDAYVLSIIELFGGSDEKHWLIPIEEFPSYYYSIGMNKVLENVIYSPTGQWGIKFTMDQYAIAGGSQEFIQILRQKWPTSIDNGITPFLNEFMHDHKRFGINFAWIEQFLEHIYGTAKAHQLLLPYKIKSS